MAYLCDYCEQPIADMEGGRAISAPEHNVDLHDDCRRPFFRELKKIRGDRPQSSPNTSREG